MRTVGLYLPLNREKSGGAASAAHPRAAAIVLLLILLFFVAGLFMINAPHEAHLLAIPIEMSHLAHQQIGLALFVGAFPLLILYGVLQD